MQGSEAQPEAQQTLHVPNAYVGAVIGAQGTKIAQLQRVSQAHIGIEKEQNDPRAITVSGPASAVARAVTMLNEVLDAEKLRMAGGGAASRPPGAHTVEIVALSSRCGVVIGRGGENIRELQARSGARVQVTFVLEQWIRIWSETPGNEKAYAQFLALMAQQQLLASAACTRPRRRSLSH